ncbi:hypothetical protein KL86PLE_90438 [uncultured Pleomorphomonas sp.]|uniref:Uncharacterized protein n=1 Tax=uncultured Pleomorphomonas sp. TaxID=442121 RepID=A0A212LPK4_9HYPH|nr:hypothetical protein KL86PLE_90438 [uncultured Pleomorphomonas sp.]
MSELSGNGSTAKIGFAPDEGHDVVAKLYGLRHDRLLRHSSGSKTPPKIQGRGVTDRAAHRPERFSDGTPICLTLRPGRSPISTARLILPKVLRLRAG